MILPSLLIFIIIFIFILITLITENRLLATYIDHKKAFELTHRHQDYWITNKSTYWSWVSCKVWWRHVRSSFEFTSKAELCPCSNALQQCFSSFLVVIQSNAEQHWVIPRSLTLTLLMMLPSSLSLWRSFFRVLDVITSEAKPLGLGVSWTKIQDFWGQPKELTIEIAKRIHDSMLSDLEGDLAAGAMT